MYGKIFSSMFTGSMYGAGAPVFAVMSFVVANMKPDKEVGFQVELNVKDLSNRIGEPESTIQRAIDFLCAPDEESRTEAEEGRRLVKIGAFDYRVVNGVKYAEIRKEEERREANRGRQQKFRDKNKPAKRGKPSPGETGAVRSAENGHDPEGILEPTPKTVLPAWAKEEPVHAPVVPMEAPVNKVPEWMQ